MKTNRKHNRKRVPTHSRKIARQLNGRFVRRVKRRRPYRVKVNPTRRRQSKAPFYIVRQSNYGGWIAESPRGVTTLHSTKESAVRYGLKRARKISYHRVKANPRGVAYCPNPSSHTRSRLRKRGSHHSTRRRKASHKSNAARFYCHRSGSRYIVSRASGSKLHRIGVFSAKGLRSWAARNNVRMR